MSAPKKRIRSRQLNDDIPKWLSIDWTEDDDVGEKLEMILGKEEAHEILNPTMIAKPTPLFLQPLLGEQQETPCAETLWNSLRATSNKNLQNESSKRDDATFIHQNTRKTTMHSQRADTYRQHVEMMHKVAHINEFRTKRLLDTIKLPNIIASVSECHSSIEIDESKEQQHQQPRYQNVRNCRSEFIAPSKSLQRSSARARSFTCPTLHSKHIPNSNSDDNVTLMLQRNPTPVRFLTESACCFDGKFRDRMRTLGVEPKIGISCPQLTYKSSLASSSSSGKPSFENLKLKTSEPLRKVSRVPKRTVGKSQSWEPLSLAALAEYTHEIQAPGSGTFNSGQTTLWKTKLEEMIA